jgi:hypothetical protein
MRPDLTARLSRIAQERVSRTILLVREGAGRILAIGLSACVIHVNQRVKIVFHALGK